MKNKIIAVVLMLALLTAGCVVEAEDRNAEAVDNEELEADAAAMLNECNEQVDKMMALVLPILEYEANSASKLLTKNALDNIAKFNQRVKEVEKTLDETEGIEFTGKKKYISANRELVRITKEMVAMYSELYSFNLELEEKETLAQKNDKSEDLHNAIVNCRCNEVDCISYSESSLKFMDDSIKIFRKIESKYGLEIFGSAADEWAKDKEIAENHWPGLIKKASTYGDKCYKINDAYSRYLNDFDSVERATENEIADAVSSKWLLSMMNLASEMTQAGVDVDSARNGVEA
jgi:PBP1b-binding outer membrane lipoprotein LpoB